MNAWTPGALLSGNVLVALAAAAAWGGGDFSGGMGVKAAGGSPKGALRVVILAHAASLAVLLAILFAIPAMRHEVWPLDRWHRSLLAWGLGSGIAAGLSLTAFYVALARGAMGASAAMSGLLAAAIPAVVSRVVEGAPTAWRLVGFGLAGAAIWIIAAGSSAEWADLASERIRERQTMLLAVAGGLGFGFYFVALRMDNPLGAVAPVALSRVGSLVTCLVLLFAVRAGGRGSMGEKQGLRLHPAYAQDDEAGSKATRCGLSRTAVGWALVVALLDTGGNLLFLEATRMGRLDVAAVLASLYPASTILLAAWVLHERPTRRQVLGMVVALAAVGMITI
jgi:drug/metabolite transporter (DMT)-like permease